MFDQLARSSEPISNYKLRTLFGLSQVHCDTQTQLLGGKLLLAIDGTGTFASTRVSCKYCCVKKPNRNQKTDQGPEF